MDASNSQNPKKNREIAPAKGRLGVLLPGMGAVATTLIAGVNLVKKGLGEPIGSLTQMQKIRLGKRTDPRAIPIKDFVPLAGLNDLVFGGWDITPENAYETACNSGVLSENVLTNVRQELESVKPWPGVFEHDYVRRLNGTHVKTGDTKMALAEALIDDIKQFLKNNDLERAVMVWCGSTEVYSEPGPVHETVKAFEQGLRDNAEEIPPSMIYAYAAIKCGVPYANGAPNLSVDCPALIELADQLNVPVTGKDFKTGQTLMKTIIAPGLKARMLGLDGWFSTNLIGNKDGEVLDDEGSFKSKEVSLIQPNEEVEL